jgi:hypothetical protein
MLQLRETRDEKLGVDLIRPNTAVRVASYVGSVIETREVEGRMVSIGKSVIGRSK